MKTLTISILTRRGILLSAIVLTHLILLASLFVSHPPKKPLAVQKLSSMYLVKNVMKEFFKQTEKKIQTSRTRALASPTGNNTAKNAEMAETAPEVPSLDDAFSKIGKGSGKEAVDAQFNLPHKYRLPDPKIELGDVETPAQQAARDVRSNSVKLTKLEKFATTVGTYDCVFQRRRSDGTILRVPGRWIEVPARSDMELKSLRRPRFCIRYNQAEDEFGNDMTEISAGIKGKN